LKPRPRRIIAAGVSTADGPPAADDVEADLA
jgi:hypothetical protein